MRTVSIVQEYVPRYRVPFFEQLANVLAEHGISLSVYAGGPSRSQAQRNDSALLPLLRPLKQWEFSILGRRIVLSDAVKKTKGSDLVIYEQARRNMSLYESLLRPQIRPHVALWGHGTDYAVSKSRVDQALLRFLTNRVCWFFGYTQQSVDRVVHNGFSAANVTRVDNAIDTQMLQQSVRNARRSGMERDGFGMVFLGGLDESKRIPFLLAALERVLSSNPTSRIDFIGDGVDRRMVDEFVHGHERRKAWGGLDGLEKAEVLASADVIVMPGRVGLVALDSFAAGIPIITANYELHAPEFSYLTNRVNCVVAGNTVSEFSEALQEVIDDPEFLDELKAACVQKANEYSIERMVTNFSEGVISALALVANGCDWSADLEK